MKHEFARWNPFSVEDILIGTVQRLYFFEEYIESLLRNNVLVIAIEQTADLFGFTFFEPELQSHRCSNSKAQYFTGGVMRNRHVRFCFCVVAVGFFMVTGCKHDMTGPNPQIRLVVTNPPPGLALPTPNGYPSGTVISSDKSQITFPLSGSASRVWFKLELSGWGSNGVSGYDAYVLRSAYRCPVQPCNCYFLRQDQTSCIESSTCHEGAQCVSGKCLSASIKDDLSYVFNGKDFLPSIYSSDPNQSWNVRLSPEESPKSDPNSWLAGGSLMLDFTDACPQMHYVKLDFSTTLTKFLLGNGTWTTPSMKGATVKCE